jgi:hypothetical protein
MPPGWVNALAQAFLAASFLSTIAIAADVARHPQRMAVMNVVWPVTALYWGPATLWFYAAAGRSAARNKAVPRHDPSMHASRQKPSWRSTAVGVSHCGAGCTLGDIAGEWMVLAFAWKLFGDDLYAAYVVDFGLAFLLGIAFQYFSIAPMRGLGVKDGIIAALKADTASIITFEIGLFGWMALSHFILFPGTGVESWVHWFMMQVGMMLGFLTSYPANWLLLRAGIKEAM